MNDISHVIISKSTSITMILFYIEMPFIINTLSCFYLIVFYVVIDNTFTSSTAYKRTLYLHIPLRI